MKEFFKTIKRYLRVYKTLLRLNVIRLFAYRANFLNSALAHTTWGMFVLISMILLTSRASGVAGWNQNELLLFAGIYNIIFSVFYFFFSRNFGELSNMVHYGRLDGLLVKPIDSQFLVTCTYVGYTHVIRFVIGIVFVVIILLRMHSDITVMTVLWFIFFMIFSIGIMYSVWLAVLTITVWFSKLSNLVSLMYELNGIARYPQEIYKGAGNVLLILFFPLTLVIATPVKALLSRMLLGDILLPMLFAVVLFYLSRKFWQFALRSYTSASG
jgi:ABC-2 type transport system permease protein